MGWVVNVVVVALAAGAPVDLQALVSKAGQHAVAQEKALETVKLTTTERQQELNGSGKVKHNSVIVESRTPVPGGQPKYFIEKAIEDGNDISNEESKRMRLAVKGADKPGEGRIDDPFLPSEQAKYRFWMIGPEAKHPGWVRVGFAPKGAPNSNLVVGEAVIDDQGYLRHLEEHPARNPSHIDEAHMTSDWNTPSPWGPLRTKMTVEAKGRIFFFFHRQMKGSVEYAYDLPKAASQEKPQPAPDAGSPDAGTPAPIRTAPPK